MNFSLGRHFEEYVRGKVESGRYNNASEVIRDALRLHEEQEILRDAKRDWLRGEIQAGLDSGDPEPLDMRAIKAEARRKFEGR